VVNTHGTGMPTSADSDPKHMLPPWSPNFDFWKSSAPSRNESNIKNDPRMDTQCGAILNISATRPITLLT
jgi:hypothetical protein